MAAEFLLPSATEFDVTIFRGQQYGEGRWKTSHWCAGLRDKARSMLRAAEESAGEIFVWADADVVFLKPCKTRLSELLGDRDIACQHERHPGYLCTGFFIARSTPAIRQVFTTVATAPYLSAQGDQEIFNDHKHVLNWASLPSAEFWTRGHGGTIPATARVYHANFIIGIAEKMQALREVQEELNNE